MGLGAKSVEILAQLLTKSQIAMYPNMIRFLRVYGYSGEFVSSFNGDHYYPAGGMPYDEHEEWGSIIIRQYFAPRGGETGAKVLTKLTNDFLNEIEDNVLGIDYKQLLGPSDIKRFLRFLELDGFKYEGNTLVPIEYNSQRTLQTKSLMESIIDRNHELSAPVLTQHLRECEENYQIGHWKDSIAQARNFVEQLLEDIAKACAAAKAENPDLSKPVKVRDYLTQAGFFEKKEREKLVDGVYGHLSEEGSHPGISDDNVARISRSIIISFGYYILEKFETWKKNNFLRL